MVTMYEQEREQPRGSQYSIICIHSYCDLIYRLVVPNSHLVEKLNILASPIVGTQVLCPKPFLPYVFAYEPWNCPGN
jgi:hypothetical protein